MFENLNNFKDIYFLFVEGLIALTVYCVFFMIFMNTYYISTAENILYTNFKKQLDSYNFVDIFGVYDGNTTNKNLNNSSILETYNLIKSNNNELQTQDLTDTSAQTMNKTIIICTSILGFFYVLLIIPIIMGKITFKDFDFIQIIFAFLLHCVLIISLELLFILIISNKYTYIKAYMSFPLYVLANNMGYI